MAKNTNLPATRKEFLDLLRAARQAAREKFGDELLPINPATGKRWTNTGRTPTTGAYSPILPIHGDLPPVSLEGRWMSRRERAAQVRERMQRFSAIYNAGWLMRDTYFGPAQRREQYAVRFIAVLLQEMRSTRDYEALLYAVADALTCSSLGVPWEG